MGCLSVQIVLIIKVARCICQFSSLNILLRKDGLLKRYAPINAQRVIDKLYAAFALRCIEGIAFVLE